MMLEEEKKKLIEEWNRNFRTILSYGYGEMVTMGQFVVKDIQEDEYPPEYENIMSKKQFTRVILTKIDDENVQIVLPMTTFLEKYANLAEINADKLSIGSDFFKCIESTEKEAEWQMMDDETLRLLLTDAEIMTLEEADADYTINGEIQPSNCSICPIDLGIYREKIKEWQRSKEEGQEETTSTSAKKVFKSALESLMAEGYRGDIGEIMGENIERYDRGDR